MGKLTTQVTKKETNNRENIMGMEKKIKIELMLFMVVANLILLVSSARPMKEGNEIRPLDREVVSKLSGPSPGEGRHGFPPTKASPTRHGFQPMFDLGITKQSGPSPGVGHGFPPSHQVCETGMPGRTLEEGFGVHLLDDDGLKVLSHKWSLQIGVSA